MGEGVRGALAVAAAPREGLALGLREGDTLVQAVPLAVALALPVLAKLEVGEGVPVAAPEPVAAAGVRVTEAETEAEAETEGVLPAPGEAVPPPAAREGLALTLGVRLGLRVGL